MAEQPVQLLCPQCDEVFVPQFYRICPACGDDAGSGIEPPQPQAEPYHRRVLLVAYCLLGLAAMLWLYFWLLFRDL